MNIRDTEKTKAAILETKTNKEGQKSIETIHNEFHQSKSLDFDLGEFVPFFFERSPGLSCKCGKRKTVLK